MTIKLFSKKGLPIAIIINPTLKFYRKDDFLMVEVGGTATNEIFAINDEKSSYYFTSHLEDKTIKFELTDTYSSSNYPIINVGYCDESSIVTFTALAEIHYKRDEK